jgi:tripartite-type tricarboxylate transporter receptor subunit TctC
VRKLLGILLALSCGVALAQDYPSKPIRIYHGFTPGGPVDIIARLMAQSLTDHFRQQAIVEGKPGAGGTIGAGFVAKSDPDGHTLFLMASGHSTSPGLYKSLTYDPVDDFTMISMLASAPFAVMTTPASPYRTIEDMVKDAKANPGKINFGTGGVGSGMHLVAVLLQARAGIQMNHIPYKGGNAPVLALFAGEVPVLFSSVAGVTPHVESGKMRILAVSTRKRYGALPNVPTIAETVLPGFDALAWYALAGPKNLPAPVVAKLNEAAHVALKRKDVAERIAAQGAESWGTTPAEAQAFLRSEVSRWTKVIRDENISAQ